MERLIKQVAVLGSGVMGSRIACHFANIGVQVLLLDIVPKDAPEGNKQARNKIVNDALQNALKSNPSPIYSQSFVSRIQTGNFDDDLEKIKDADWIIEVVIERLDIKQALFERVERYRKPGALVSSNTSGIPIHFMTKDRSDDFKAHFCGTHFFNPPRYLRLLEIIPTADTLPEVTNFLMSYGEKYLGKTTVLCKDTPAFIANRIGVFSIASILKYVAQSGMTIDEVDKLTGPVIGRPKSATFRTADVVGLDTLALVTQGLYSGLADDEAKDTFKLPDFIDKMLANQWLGSKTSQGFFKKVKGEDGKSEILSLNLNTLEYESASKPKFAVLDITKTIDKLSDRFKVLLADKDRAGDFYRTSFYSLFAYVSNRIPEIADELYKIDDAIEAGFGWETGPYKIWDAIGLEQSIAAIEGMGYTIATWVKDMIAAGHTSFYVTKAGKRYYYDIPSKDYKLVPGTEAFIDIDLIGDDKVIWRNSGTLLKDIGDGILNLEFATKMNTIGSEILEGVNKAIDIAEKNYKGLVISNTGANFSAGANVGLIFMMAVEEEWDELDFAIRQFQNTMMRIRYSAIPVVVAPHNMALGGGCEMCLHADMVVAHAESYIGLVEFGVGLIPGGGGSKEFAVRISDELKEGDVALNRFRQRFLTIGQAKVSTSAQEAFELGYLVYGRDKIVVSYKRLLSEAKNACLQLAQAGYTKPIPRKDITVLGKQALGLAYLGADSMRAGKYISDHDVKISQKLGYVLAGGDLSTPTKVSEQYLLDLERLAFMELCAERKTLERIQSILNGGKVLRN